MKGLHYHRFCTAILILLITAGVQAQSGSASPTKSVREVFDKSISGAERAVLAVGQIMPAERYSFVSTNGEFAGVRNFGQMLKHIAVDNYVNGAALMGEAPPVQTGSHENGPNSLVEKEAILKFVRDSFAYLHRAVATVNQENMLETISYPDGGKVNRLTVVMAASAHPWDLYGQMIEYLRMNNINPQGSH